MLTLVTGATGEVGRRFVPRLLQWTAPGDGVRVLVRDEARGVAAARLGAQVAVGELRDPEAVRKALAGVDAVVNIAAAFRGVPDEEAWTVNRDAAVDLGRAAVEAGAGRFVQVSTNLVYGAGRGRPAVEDDEPLPDTAMWGAYPASKAEAERGLLELHREHGLDVRIGRLAFVYGEGDAHLAQSLRWAGGWAGHKRLPMVHHADVAQGLLRLLRAPGAAG
ncbi:NAD-dependent epimerase/dehydratase family protein, partial [Streptomyces sp. H10-C2]|uniref:NAD-dependent epimerase/dehydratase family protein n=2 Tax=unclassified Streptomyces TaxID=2593676 RepID=UPI0024BB6432